MIQANELRIGNHVLYKPYGNRDGEHVTIAGLMGVKAYFSKYNNEGAMFHYLQPIPLTPAILENYGFEKRLEYWEPRVGDAKGAWYTQKDIFIVVLKSTGEIYRAITANGDEFANVTGPELTSLHQLQNIYFSLTGEELKIRHNDKVK